MTESLLEAREDDGLDYVRNYYGVPAVVGRRVLYKGDEGTIIGGEGQYLHVKLGGKGDSREPFVLHPTWEITYVMERGERV